MDFYKLFAFKGILIESLKIIAKNLKIVAILFTISTILQSSIFAITTISTRKTLRNLVDELNHILLARASTPDSPNLLGKTNNDIIFVIYVQCIVSLMSNAISLASIGSVVLVSAATYCGKNVTFQNLIPKLANKYLKQVVTWFHIKLLALCYLLYFFLMLVAPIPFLLHRPFFLIAIWFTISGVAIIFLTYVSIVWKLAMVITVIEENYFGRDALGKASRLIKGKRIQGYALNFIFTLGPTIVEVVAMNQYKQFVTKQVIIGIFVICFNIVNLLLLYTSYTVLYFQCKKSHGEEINLQGEWGYSELAYTGEDIP